MLFRLAWALSNKRSFLSGLPLGQHYNTRLFPNCFAHVLSKAQNKYPHFKLYLGNIYLLTPGEHYIYDHGRDQDRIKYSKQVETADWSKIDKVGEDLKVLYQDTFPKMQGRMIMKYDKEEVAEKIEALNMLFFQDLKDKKKVNGSNVIANLKLLLPGSR